MVCFAGGDTSKKGKSREIKGSQGESREIKRSQGKSRGVKGINVNRGNKGSRETIGKGNKGIFIVRESYVYEGMFMYGCVCFFG